MLNIILSLTFAIALCTTTETTAATRIPNDLNITDTDGNTMLHHACYTRDEENISALITTQNIKQKNNDGNTPLGIACKFSIPGTAIQLLNYIEAGDKRLLPILNTKHTSP
jgi:ankyrin repeat protein